MPAACATSSARATGASAVMTSSSGRPPSPRARRSARCLASAPPSNHSRTRNGTCSPARVRVGARRWPLAHHPRDVQRLPLQPVMQPHRLGERLLRALDRRGAGHRRALQRHRRVEHPVPRAVHARRPPRADELLDDELPVDVLPGQPEHVVARAPCLHHHVAHLRTFAANVQGAVARGPSARASFFFA